MTDDEFLNDRDCTPKGETPRVDALRNSSDHPTPAGELWQLAYDLERELNECRSDFAALQRAIVGETGLSAILEATRLRAELSRALRVVEAAQAFAAIEFHPELKKALREWEARR